MTVVSVIVPCYDVADFIGSAVDRLLQQTHRDLQLVLVDDGSKDSTAQRITALAADPRVIAIVQPENRGAAAARETAVAAATGDYVWFVDADDEWPDDAVARLLVATGDGTVDVVVAGAEYRAPDRPARPVGAPLSGLLTGDEAFRLFLRGRISGHLWNKLFRRPLLDGIEFTRTRQHSDQAMVAQLLAAAARVAAIPDIVYGYRLRAGSIIRSGSKRAASLAAVGAVVRQSAAVVGVTGQDLDYYRARFELLSRMKDATSGAYPAEEGARLARAVRHDIDRATVVALLRAGDRRRAVLLAAAKVVPIAYRIAMASPEARA